MRAVTVAHLKEGDSVAIQLPASTLAVADAHRRDGELTPLELAEEAVSEAEVPALVEAVHGESCLVATPGGAKFRHVSSTVHSPDRDQFQVTGLAELGVDEDITGSGHGGRSSGGIVLSWSDTPGFWMACGIDVLEPLVPALNPSGQRPALSLGARHVLGGRDHRRLIALYDGRSRGGS